MTWLPTRPLSGWQQPLAPHRICHTREWFRRFRNKSCPWIAEAPNCHRVLSGSASFDILSGRTPHAVLTLTICQGGNE
jgi:hypothetical protein